VVADEPADAAAEGESGDPGAGHQPAGQCQAEGLGLVVEVAPQAAGLRDDPTGCRIDPDPGHRGQVQDEPAVGGGEAGDAVSATAHREREPLAAGELDPADHVGHAGGADDRDRPGVVGAVPDRPGLVVVRAGGRHQLPAQRLRQLRQGGLSDGYRLVLGHGHAFVLQVPHRLVIPTLGGRALHGLSAP
jgi:hypothetical protein